MIELNKSISKYQGTICFLAVTATYFFLRWLTFKGFNGTDDLHYAFLSSNLLKGQYNPFVANDIFSGRVLLIAWQAIIYFIFGITTFSTQVGTLIVTMICCYLTVFKLARFNEVNTILLASALFYFNPVLSEATLGVMPDIFIMLAGIIIFILWDHMLREESRRPIIFQSIACGLIVFAAMFFKENALIFIPFLFLLALWTGDKKLFLPAFVIIITFSFCVLLSGLVYFYFTGDFFFRVHQVLNSAYPNVCDYAMFSTREKFARLTYGVWVQFIIESFYPVILAALLILLHLLFDKNFRLKKSKIVIVFTILFVLGLYFPFSLHGYQPLCSRPRHFIFLLPPAVIITTNFFKEARKNQWFMWLFIFASAAIFFICLFDSVEKWYWMVYGLLLSFFVIQKLNTFHFSSRSSYVVFSGILALYMPYRLFFMNSNWFQNMQSISKEIKGNYYYFPDHDNMMHWKMLHRFDTSIHTISLEVKPFKSFEPYYEKAGAENFKPGWLIVNYVYNQTGQQFLQKTDSLSRKGFFRKEKCVGSICAYYIDTPGSLNFIKKMEADEDKNSLPVHVN